jgi:hypothetical protein
LAKNLFGREIALLSAKLIPIPERDYSMTRFAARSFLAVLLLLVLIPSLTQFAFSQSQAGQGAIAGTVTDATKAVIPGATVTLSNPGIGYSQTVTTGSGGGFTFAPLTVIGGYKLSVRAKGFSEAVVDNFATSVGTTVTRNVTLLAGGSTESIVVEGGSVEQVQTDTSAVSQLIDNTIFQNSPLETRSQNTFVGLVAGAAPDTAGTGRGFSINGARTGAGNFMLDGFDNNDQGLGGGAAGGAVTTISPDAIEEYRVVTSVPNAEYGRAGGFATDTVLKSGSNRWHGSAFEYNRIQALSQNNWFSKQSGLRDHLVRNQFGGSIGGTIKKDKTFFYATVELHRRSTGSPDTFTGITQDFYTFVTSGNYKKFMEGTAFQNTAVRADGTIGTGFCPQYVAPTCTGGFASVATVGPVFAKNYAATPKQFPFGTRNFTDEPTDLLLGGTTYLPVNIYGDGTVLTADKLSQNRGTIKLDHKLTGRDQLSFTYSADLDNDNVSTGGGDAFPGPPELNFGGAQIFGATWSHTFTANLINTFKAGYLRHVRNFTADSPAGVSSTYAADNLGTGFGATSGFPQFFTENQFSYDDSVTFTHAHHTIKAGFRFVRTRNGSSFYNDVNGTQYFWGAAGLMTDGLNEQAGIALDPGDFTPYGTMYYASASLDPTTGLAPDPYRGYRANEFATYLQDDWKVSPKLTLNYGLRWEYFGPPHNAKPGIDSNVYFGTDSTLKATLNPFAPNTPILLGEQGATFQYAQANGRSTIWARDTNNFAPRFGFSFDTFGNGKLVMRGGFGLGYDRLYNNVYENIRFNGPRFVDNAYGFGAGNGAISPALRAALVQSPFTGNAALAVAGASPVPRHVNQNLKTAYYEQTHFGIESGIHGYVIEANYINTLGRQLVGLMNANTFEGRTACSTAALQVACKAAGVTVFSTTRPSTLFGNDNFRTNGFGSNYNSAQVSVRKGYSHGLQLLANYTYGKALDQISDVFTLKGGGTGIPTPYNASNNYGPADFDLRHRAAITLNYETRSASHKLLLAGWGISPILTMRSGSPINIKNGSSSYDPNRDGTLGVERAVYTGTGNPNQAYNHNVSPAGGSTKYSGALGNQFKAYTCPISVHNGLFCDVPGRNSLYGLRQYNLDAAVSKHLHFSELWSLTLQAAFFDIDGHVQFSDPVGDINNANFGKSTSSGNRTGQLSARFDF